MTTRCHSLLLVCYTLSLVYHSSSFVITRCHSLSLVGIRCHLLSFAVTRCTTHCPLLSLVVIRCHSLYYSLSFDVLLVSLFINNQRQHPIISIHKVTQQYRNSTRIFQGLVGMLRALYTGIIQEHKCLISGFTFFYFIVFTFFTKTSTSLNQKL